MLKFYNVIITTIYYSFNKTAGTWCTAGRRYTSESLKNAGQFKENTTSLRFTFIPNSPLLYHRQRIHSTGLPNLKLEGQKQANRMDTLATFATTIRSGSASTRAHSGAKHSSEAARVRDEEVINSTLASFGLIPGKVVSKQRTSRKRRKKTRTANSTNDLVVAPPKKRRGQSSPAASIPKRKQISGHELSGLTVPRKWLPWEDEALHLAHEKYGGRNWKAIAQGVPGRNHVQCLQRWKKVLKPGLRKGVWDKKEDAILIELYHAEVERCKQLEASEVTLLENVSENNIAKKRGVNWAGIATQIEGRTTKQCRERWNNHLDPTIKRGNWTPEEDRLLLGEQKRLGNKWSKISQLLEGRTENAVKIRWKSLIRHATKSTHIKTRKNEQDTSISNSPFKTSTLVSDSIVDSTESLLQRGGPRASIPLSVRKLMNVLPVSLYIYITITNIY